jgi:hypothetical protein
MSVNDTLAHQAYIMTNYLQVKYDGKMVVQLDLLHRDYLEAFPQVVDTFRRQCAKKGRLPDLLDTIIVEETGRVLPVAYGFDADFAIGNVHSFNNDLFEQFIANKIPALKTLFAATMEKILSNKQADIVNWSEILIAESKKHNQYA